MQQLKDDVYIYIMQPSFRKKLMEETGLTDQSIRLWVYKKDMRLLCYPIMKLIATEMKCNIDALLKF